MKIINILFTIAVLYPLVTLAQHTNESNNLQTNLWLTIDITEIKIKDISETPYVDDTGEFHFEGKRPILYERGDRLYEVH